VIQYGVEFALEGYGEDIILDVMIDACMTLPDPLCAYCVTFVYQNIDRLIELIEDGIPAEGICTIFGFCPDSNTIRMNLVPKDGSFCGLCLDLVDETENCDRLTGLLGIVCRSMKGEQIAGRGVDKFEACRQMSYCGGKDQISL
jgi:hypothetical protein